jgi:hypothetical protein
MVAGNCRRCGSPYTVVHDPATGTLPRFCSAACRGARRKARRRDRRKERESATAAPCPSCEGPSPDGGICAHCEARLRRMCAGKVKYPSGDVARAATDVLRAKTGVETLNWYSCLRCDGFHVGNPGRDQPLWRARLKAALRERPDA